MLVLDQTKLHPSERDLLAALDAFAELCSIMNRRLGSDEWSSDHWDLINRVADIEQGAERLRRASVS